MSLKTNGPQYPANGGAKNPRGPSAVRDEAQYGRAIVNKSINLQIFFFSPSQGKFESIFLFLIRDPLTMSDKVSGKGGRGRNPFALQGRYGKGGGGEKLGQKPDDHRPPLPITNEGSTAAQPAVGSQHREGSTSAQSAVGSQHHVKSTSAQAAVGSEPHTGSTSAQPAVGSQPQGTLGDASSSVTLGQEGTSASSGAVGPHELERMDLDALLDGPSDEDDNVTLQSLSDLENSPSGSSVASRLRKSVHVMTPTRNEESSSIQNEGAGDGGFQPALSKHQKKKARKLRQEAERGVKRPPPTPEQVLKKNEEQRAKRLKTYADAASKHLVLQVTWSGEKEGVEMTSDDLDQFVSLFEEQLMEAPKRVKIEAFGVRNGRIRVAFADPDSKELLKKAVNSAGDGVYRAWEDEELPSYERASVWLPAKRGEPKEWLTKLRKVYQADLSLVDVRFWGSVKKEEMGSTIILGLSPKAREVFKQDKDVIYVGFGRHELYYASRKKQEGTALSTDEGK